MFHNANCSSHSLKDQEDLPAEEMELEETRGEHKRGVQPAATARGKLSPSVIYSLLGVTTLLFVLTLGIAVILMAQMLSEKQVSYSGFRVEYSQAKDQLYCAVEWTRFKQHCYHFSTKANGWVEAQRSCASADAHLVVINNAEEQAFIRKALPDQMHWIGLSDMVHAGDWRWVDGTDYFSSVKFWSEGEPNYPQSERCVETYTNGMWNNRQCNVHRHWICEKPASTTPPPPPSTLELP